MPFKRGDILRVVEEHDLLQEGVNRSYCPGPVGTTGIYVDDVGDSPIPWVYFPELGCEAIAHAEKMEKVGEVEP